MKKPTKKTIKETIYCVDLEGTVDELIKQIEEWKNHWGTQYSGLFVEKEYWGDYEGLVLFGEREETDAEFEKRLKEEAKIKQENKANKEKRKAQLIKEAKKLGLKVVES